MTGYLYLAKISILECKFLLAKSLRADMSDNTGKIPDFRTWEWTDRPSFPVGLPAVAAAFIPWYISPNAR
jgi:hypothetical protein